MANDFNILTGKNLTKEEAFDYAFHGALDNELCEGYDGQEARERVLMMAGCYADNYGVDATEFTAYVKKIVVDSSF